ncbi:MAG: hypothetical protein WA399_02370 [Acidobacteriaceae bacterium]
MVASSSMATRIAGERGRGDTAWPWIIVLAGTALYFFAFFNRFGGLRSGDGEFGGGMALLAGRLPYRDYFTAGPPLNSIKAAIELSLFGKALIVSRACAVVERLALAGVMYAWLRRGFGAWASSLAALVTVIISAGDHTDPVASYNHDAILFAMLCGFAASVSLEVFRPRRTLLLALASGGAAGLSALTKQTIGLGTAVAVAVIAGVACARLFNIRRCVAWLIVYWLGFAVPVGVVAAYLAHLGVLHACLQMLFVSGPHAKAGKPGMFLLREMVVALGYWIWLLLGIAGLALGGPAIVRSIAAEKSDESELPRWGAFAAVALITIGAAEILALTRLPALRDYSKSAVYFTFVGTTIFGLIAIDLALKRSRKSTLRLWQIAILAAVGWSVAFTLCLSWQAFEAMTIPGLGLLLAAAVEGTRGWGRRFLYAVMIGMVFLAVREKLDLPFSFDSQDEAPVRMATVRSNLPELRGMRLPAEEVRLLDETVPLMQSAAAHHQTVFTYPEFGLLYALSGANPPTWAGSHNIDVVSDSLARQDAERLLQHPPQVISYARPTEQYLRVQEAIWRDGRPSGQRDLINAIDSLLPQYRLVDTFQLMPDDTPISLYVRKQ